MESFVVERAVSSRNPKDFPGEVLEGHGHVVVQMNDALGQVRSSLSCTTRMPDVVAVGVGWAERVDPSGARAELIGPFGGTNGEHRAAGEGVMQSGIAQGRPGPA